MRTTSLWHQQQERPRATVKMIGKKPVVRVVDPPKSRSAKKRIAQELKKKNITPTDKPIKAIIDIFVEIPKSYTKKKKAAIEAGELRPAKKPDVSNYIKLIEDACNGILYIDDSQIVEVLGRKFYSETPRIEIEIIEL